MGMSTFTMHDEFNVTNVKVWDVKNFLQGFIINTKVNNFFAIVTYCVMVRVFLVFKLGFIAIEVEFLQGTIFGKGFEVTVDGDEVDMGELCMHLSGTHTAVVGGDGVEDFLAVFGLAHSY